MVGEPVVVGATLDLRELRVRDRLDAEQQRRIQDRDGDALAFHVGDSRPGIPGRGATRVYGISPRRARARASAPIPATPAIDMPAARMRRPSRRTTRRPRRRSRCARSARAARAGRSPASRSGARGHVRRRRRTRGPGPSQTSNRGGPRDASSARGPAQTRYCARSTSPAVRSMPAIRPDRAGGPRPAARENDRERPADLRGMLRS